VSQETAKVATESGSSLNRAEKVHLKIESETMCSLVFEMDFEDKNKVCAIDMAGVLKGSLSKKGL